MTPNSAARAAQTLRNRVIALKEGDFLGYEEELIEELGVSRPTFRQAARVLSHEQLLTIKRGVGGGFYVRKPDIESVGRAVSTYLRSRNTTLYEVLEANFGLMVQAIHRALASTDKFALGKLASLRGRLLEASTDEESPASLLKWEREFAGIIGELCGNPAIELCIHMFNQFGRDQDSDRVWEGHQKRISKWSELRLEAVEAILKGHTEDAEKAFAERGRLMCEWLKKDSRQKSHTA